MAFIVPTYELAEKIGRRIEIDADTVNELIEKGVARFGEDFRIATRSSMIVVNGVGLNRLRGGKTKLKAQDEVWFLKPASGG